MCPIVPIPKDEDFDVVQAGAAALIRGQRGGRLPDPFRAMLHSPAVALAWAELGSTVRYGLAIPATVRELLICYVAVFNDCDYEFAVHSALASNLGYSEASLASLADWRTSDSFNAEDRAALALAESALHRTHLAPEALELAVESFGVGSVVEIHLLVAYYVALAVVINSLGIEGTPSE